MAFMIAAYAIAATAPHPAMAADCSVDALNVLSVAHITVSSATLVPAAPPK